MRNLPDCYDYIRNYYRVPAYIGMRVRAGGREGVLVRATGSTQYLHIKFDDGKSNGVYHPTDGIEYIGVSASHAQ